MENTPINIFMFLIAVIAAVAAVLVTLMMLIVLNRRRQRLFETSVVVLKEDHERHLLHTQVEIHEQTLKDISQEIHDNISLYLTLAKLALYPLEERPDTRESARTTLNLIGDAIRDLSAISKSLDSDLIAQQGLIKAIYGEAERMRRCTRVNLELQVTGDGVYMQGTRELFLFRVVQEALNNVLKHAEATQVRLDLHYAEQLIQLTIADNGRGFEPTGLEKKGGAGLRNMRNRVEAFGGSFRLCSGSEGTTLFITIPIIQHAN
jgi:two-component system NarL family sensor kinase